LKTKPGSGAEKITEKNRMKENKMSVKTATAFLLFISMVAGITTPVFAAERQVTFKVPLILTDLHPDVSEVGVECKVLDKYDASLGWAAINVPVSNGTYSGTVSITVNVADNDQPVGWRCSLTWLHDNSGHHCLLAPNPQYPFCDVKCWEQSSSCERLAEGVF
jgi:hypothetical protein